MIVDTINVVKITVLTVTVVTMPVVTMTIVTMKVVMMRVVTMTVVTVSVATITVVRMTYLSHSSNNDPHKDQSQSYHTGRHSYRIQHSQCSRTHGRNMLGGCRDSSDFPDRREHNLGKRGMRTACISWG